MHVWPNSFLLHVTLNIHVCTGSEHMLLSTTAFPLNCILCLFPLAFLSNSLRPTLSPPCSCSWSVYKHARPLPEEIVHFPPYNEKQDAARGTTVQPYLEAFYHYDTGNAEEQQPPSRLAAVTTATTWGPEMGLPFDPLPTLTPPPRTLGQQGNWVSEDPCFLIEREVYSRESNTSSDKAEHSTENISMKKSRIPSRENGKTFTPRLC